MRYILALLVLCPILALAQTAEITGRVMDPTGAIVTRAEVVVTNVQSGTRVQAQTNNDGYFTTSRLEPGNYRIDIRAAGFKSAVRSGIGLAVDQVARLDFTLEVALSPRRWK